MAILVDRLHPAVRYWAIWPWPAHIAGWVFSMQPDGTLTYVKVPR